jgi:hypothetical protein
VTDQLNVPVLIVDAEVVEPIDRSDAERLDMRIRLLVGAINDNLAKLYELVEQAKAGEIHKVLGYPSWTAYVADVFSVQVRLDRQQRRELVGYLSGESMSQRAIADVVGADQATVSRDLRARDADASPEPDEPVFVEFTDGRDPIEVFASAQEAADSFAMADLSGDEFESVLRDARAQDDLSRENVARLAREQTNDKTVVGRDGKTYRSTPKNDAAKHKPRRGPITDEFWRAVSELEKAVNRVAKLAADDRFNPNRPGLCSRNLGPLLSIANKLDDDVIWRLSGGFDRHELDDPALVERIVRGDDDVT